MLRVDVGPARLVLLTLASLFLVVSSWGVTPTAPPRPVADTVSPSVRIATAGDFGSTSNSGAVLDAIAAYQPDATFALGDLSYGRTGEEQSWCDFVHARARATDPFETLSGNHESNGVNGNIDDFSACLPDLLGVSGTYGREYVADLPAAAPLVRFIGISPGLTFPTGTWSYARGTSHYQWLSEQVDAARSAGIRWVVVGMHKPCLSAGQYDCGTASADLLGLLVGKRVDLVVSGHEHFYARYHQLALGAGCDRISSTGYVAACVSDEDSSLVAGGGTLLVTVGTGGESLRLLPGGDPEAPYLAASHALERDPTYGFASVEMSDSTLTLDYRRPDGSVADHVELTSPSGDRPPSATFTVSGTGAIRDLDASGSTDTDGSILSRDWDFGDSATATGTQVSHTWTTPGTYPVTLQVTDARGSTSTTTRQVEIAETTPIVVAADDFERTESRRWGEATPGGSWQVNTAAGVASVAGGNGRTVLTSGTPGTLARLPGASASSTDLGVDLLLDQLPVGKGSRILLSAVPRRTSAGDEYRAVLKVFANGTTRLGLTQSVGTKTTALGADVSVAVGDLLASPVRVRVQALGSSPTIVRAKAWRADEAEPSAWQVSATDSTAALQSAGSIALRAVRTALSTNASIEARVDNLLVVAP